MDFRTICMLASAISTLFGLGFLLAPQASAALYGATLSDTGSVLVGRYFGSEVLMYAAAIFGLRALRDAGAQRVAARALAAATLSGLAVSLMGVSTGTINALGWSSVALYGFFVVAWLRLGFGAEGAALRGAA